MSPIDALPAGAVTCRASTLCELFDGLFGVSENTVLRGGADEPLFVPAAEGVPATIYFRDDYAASAMHEVAHWCIAGRERREQRDYGYWYEPDGRSAEQQRLFVAVEARPQALEWCFAQACGLPFRLSLDNLDAPPSDDERAILADAVSNEARRLRAEGLPPRALRFLRALADRFKPGFETEDLIFDATALR